MIIDCDRLWTTIIRKSKNSLILSSVNNKIKIEFSLSNEWEETESFYRFRVECQLEISNKLMNHSKATLQRLGVVISSLTFLGEHKSVLDRF